MRHWKYFLECRGSLFLEGATKGVHYDAESLAIRQCRRAGPRPPRLRHRWPDGPPTAGYQGSTGTQRRTEKDVRRPVRARVDPRVGNPQGSRGQGGTQGGADKAGTDCERDG
ncbi:hypothetical protein GCM10007170_29850 [Arthrobacter liuii]|uniref:Uncharacterized protein n=1 Tax=Arthrobacter liuii TaxID=1476996 RepID=A0ABQ2AX73_9MICC|nr:hypothetical protein GCM10007170_29850 [Arthrobacter liuii]